ncbi:MAG TPA: helix-turn-helix transcriptional regulator [Pyrinomonadaceae bacterium]|jgi:cytoskeleton protein RodZ|nr:helix-turn-helix transcriptional regulator [Pyrinomonadaceae bacterium]
MAASFGEELRLAREARGVTLRQISDQTRISIRYLEAIEANDYKRLPGGIFNRSFIKAYAKQIGFDEKAALEGYMRTAREQGESPDEVTSTPYKSHVYTDGGTRSPLVTVLLAALILAILFLGVWAFLHWYQRREAAREAGTPKPTVTNNAQTANGPAPPATAPGPVSPAGGFHIEVTARGESVWLSAQVDDAKKARGILLEPDKTEKFDPAARLRLQYAQVKAKALEVTINGRRAVVPPDKTELVITKEDYERLLQQ